MIVLKSFLCGMALLSSAAVGASPYCGRVFVDSNGNGLWDRNEKLLSGIRVSDGLNVTETTKDGTFSLPGHFRERFIFITTPSGYKTINRHYIRIDSATTVYDFGLTPYDPHISPDGSHRFIHISDTEIFNTTDHEDWAGNLRDYAANEGAAFIVHTGDICYENGLKGHIGLMNTSSMGLPVFYGIGNHDFVKGKYGEELYESIYGPIYYSFDVAGTHYIMTPMAYGDHYPGYNPDDVCEWLRNDLDHVASDTPVIIFNHDLPFHGSSFIYKGTGDNSVDLNDHNLKAWVYGHWHINHMKKQGDVYTICTSSLDKGGIDHATTAYRIINVSKDGSISSELRYTYLDRSLCIASPQGPTMSKAVTVNAYSSTSHIDRITYTCLYQGKTLIPYRDLDQRTDWTWTADMPLNESYAGKELTLRVQCKFKDGRTSEADSRFTFDNDVRQARFTKDWTGLLGNATHTATADSIKSIPELKWVTNVGSNIFMTSPLIYESTVYTASIDENGGEKANIYAYNAQDGSLRWKYPVENSIKNSIAIDGGLLFAQDVCGMLYAVDALTGHLRWQHQLPVNGLPALIDGLVAADGVVYAGSGKSLSAFDAGSGKLLWRNTAWGQGEGTTSTLTVGNGILIGSAQWSALYANDAATGDMIWSLSERGLRNRGASAAMHGPLLYIISQNSFFIINARTGDIVVQKEMPYNLDVTSTPLLTDGEIIFGTADKGLVALDRVTLEQKWNTLLGNSLVFTSPYTRTFASTVETSPVLAGQTVIVGASDGNIYALNPSTGKITWRYRTGAPIFSTPALSGNVLVVTDFGGNVYEFITDAPE
nr:hypothetical protein [uncultured bacterium]